MMSHEQVLSMKVGQLRSRIRLLVAQKWLCVGLTFATLAGLGLVAATRFQWWTNAVDYMGALLLVGAGAGLVVGWTRRITPMVAAQIADERAGLKERLSTAVELSGAVQRSEVAEAQIADAARHAREIRASEVVPWRAPRQLRYLAAAAAVLIAAIFVPELPIFHSQQDRIDRAAMQIQGQAIQRVAKEIEKKVAQKREDENAAILRRVAQNMKQLGKNQGRNRISKKQALLQMNALQKELRKAENRMSGGQAQKTMEKVSSELKRSAEQQARQGNSENARSLKQMAEKLEKRDFEGAKKQLEELAQKMRSAQLTPKDAEQAAETLKSMAEAMEESNLQDAAKQMKDAAKQLQQAAQAAKQLQQKMQSAKSDTERQKLQQQMSQALSQGAQMAAQQTHRAGGT